MEAAAGVTYPSRTRVLSSRSAARLRRLGLRGAAVAYLVGMIAIPIAAVITKGFGDGLGSLRSALATPGAIAAIRLTLITATLTAVINGVMGTLIAVPCVAVLSHDMTGSVVPSVSLLAYVGLVGAYALVGFGATVIPTRLALRTHAVSAMAARE